jgi:hypothetical protein
MEKDNGGAAKDDWSWDDDLRKLILREVTETYSSPEQRAAYRAGMSSASMICDSLAAFMSRKAKKDAALECGSEVWRLRELIRVEPDAMLSARKKEAGE